MQWETVIGLEIHCQLATNSKIFSGASTQYGAKANTQACAVDLGLPGVLPVLNEQAVRMAVQFGLAVNAEIGTTSIFARKNYFYPDLPKGYQISQFELPIVGRGELEIELENGDTKTIGITRAHLEEDAGKSVHEGFGEMTGIDLNRAGTPLIEIVSEPDMRCAKEAVAYMKKIHNLVRYLEISDGNMQEGSFRCDANVSIRLQGESSLGTRTELKNINSFRFVEQAINFEVERQIDILESGEEVIQETRLYDPNSNETRSMRSKEEANDYRYFPDPDLLPVVIDDTYINNIKQNLPELPDAKKNRFMEEYALNEYDAGVITAQKEMAHFFETVVKVSAAKPKLCANWLTGEFSAALNRDAIEIESSPISANDMAQLIQRINDNTISGKLAKQVFEAMWSGEGTADEIIEKKGLKQISDSGELEKIIDTIIDESPEQVAQYKNNPDKQGKLIGYFVGKLMKATQGKANPQQANEILRKKLES